MRNCRLKRVLAVTSTTPWVHSTGLIVWIYRAFIVIQPRHYDSPLQPWSLTRWWIDYCGWLPRKGDMIRKKLHRLFNKFRFKLDIQTNLKITDYLIVTLKLYNNTALPFRKHNQYPCYIKVDSRQVFKDIPNGIMFRLFTNSISSLRLNLLINLGMKRQIYVIGGTIEQGKFYGLRHHSIWL